MSEKTQALVLENEPQSQSSGLLALIERLATDATVDPDKLDKMLDVKERWENREAEVFFNRAMNTCQSEIGRVAADLENSQTRSKYASYAALDRALRPVYTRNGFSLSFDTSEAVEGWVKVLCYVSHQDGHTRTYRVAMPADGKGAKGGDVMTKTHAAGSAMSYGMRYLLKLIFNVAIGDDPDDDDGNAAAGHPVQYITEKQAERLKTDLADVNGDKARFLEYMQAESFETILAKDRPKATAAINAKAKG